MPLEFDLTTPVVDFSATSSPLKSDARRWILWPAFAYRVMLPGRSNPPFNIIQRAVLEMCQAGRRDIESISSRLALPLDLVIFVIEQLHGMDALDDMDTPTPRALRLLAEGGEPSEVEESGYVFVDGYSQRLWPRIHQGSLPVIDAEFEQGKMRFQRGTQGRPETVFATAVFPPHGIQPKKPSAYEAQKAARHHARRVRAFRREVALSSPDNLLDGLKSRGLRVIATDPEPVFVAVYVFLPKDSRQQSWLVTDPCGLGTSDLLRPGIVRLVKDGKHNVKKLLEDVAGEAWKVDEDDLAAYINEVARTSMQAVTQRLGAAAELLPHDVIKRLADADMRLNGAQTAKPIEDFLGHAYAALESVIGWLVTLYPNPSLSAVLGKTPAENAALLHEVARQCGFSSSPSLFVTRGQVRSAIEGGKGTLPFCLAAALLAAQREDNHPLLMLATRDPSALEFLDKIYRPRNDASHFTSTVATAEDALQIRDQMFSFLRDLVGADSTSVGEINSGPAEGSDLLLRIRAQAQKAIEAYPELEDSPDLRIRMIEMFDAALHLKLLSSSTATPPDTVRAKLRDAILAIAITMEAVLTQIQKASPTPKCVAHEITQKITIDREMNAQHLIRAASEIGFTLDAKGYLPQPISHAKADRIHSAAKGNKETLSASIFALVLAATQNKKHPLNELAARIPSLLLDLGRLVDARGHGDEIPQWVTAVIAEEIKEMVAKTALTVIYVLD